MEYQKHGVLIGYLGYEKGVSKFYKHGEHKEILKYAEELSILNPTANILVVRGIKND